MPARKRSRRITGSDIKLLIDDEVIAQLDQLCAKYDLSRPLIVQMLINDAWTAHQAGIKVIGEETQADNESQN